MAFIAVAPFFVGVLPETARSGVITAAARGTVQFVFNHP